MSPTNPTLNSILTQLLKGDLRLKRVAVSIVSKHHPEEVLSGYALVTELNDKVLSFFSTRKFQIDEILTITLMVDTDQMEFNVRMSHHHEQISSGRIMNAVPTAENPFPTLKFYRCFAKILDVKQNGQSLMNTVTATDAVGTMGAVDNVTELKPAALEAVPEPTNPMAAPDEGALKVA
jgi:hypothetical protein